MSRFLRLLAASALLGLPALAAGYAYGTAKPDGQGVRPNQVTGQPVIWYNPQQSFRFNFGAPYDDSAAVATEEWNAVGAPLQYQNGTAASQPCNSSDHINSAGWRTKACDDATSFGDALAVTKRSYEKIGDTWYLMDADIAFDQSRNWSIYSGKLQQEQDFHRVILHELGHALGLDHPDDAGQHVTAIMNSKTSDIDALQTDDRQGISFLYSGVTGGANNTANQSATSSSGGGGGGWEMPLLALCALLGRTGRSALMRRRNLAVPSLPGGW